MSLTDSLQRDRLIVVAVDKAAGRLRVKGEAEVCTDLACGGTVIVTEEGRTQDLGEINEGDIVTMDVKDGRAREIRVVRRVYDEYSSPEW
ncbi:MAG TPA: hypothetical protein VGV13_16780 [Methylomirabilota bacterium]|jgi:hypothetical protein|nr:hypothetical protein [Methylomirabilota bacterium]